MTGLLCIGVLILTIVAYLITKRNVSSPAVMTCTVFFISIFTCWLYILDNEQYDFSGETTGVILFVLVAMVFGNFLALKIASIKHHENEFMVGKKYHFYISIKIIMIFVAISAWFIYQYLDNISEIVSMVGGFNLDSTQYLLYAREAETAARRAGQTTYNWLDFGMSLIHCFTFVVLYCLAYNIVFWGFEKRDVRFFVPIIVFFILNIFKAARIEFLSLFLYGLTLFLMMYLIKYPHRKIMVTKQFVKYGGGGTVAFLSFFSILRYFRGGEFNVFAHMVNYIGGGLIPFNMYIDGVCSPFAHDDTFGIHTFTAFYSLLNSLGADITLVNNPGCVIFTPDFMTNIISALGNYIEDFSFIGALFLFLIIGFAFGLFNECLFRCQKMGILLIFYAESVCALYMLPIAEQLFSQHFISFSRVAHFLIIYIVFACFKQAGKVEPNSIQVKG